MSKKFSGGTPIGVGFNLAVNRPLDEREIVTTVDSLKTLSNAYGGIMVKVEDENYKIYQWNGVNQSDLTNWTALEGSGGGIPEAPIDGKQYGRQNASWTEVGGTADPDIMLKTTYDTNNNGKVDDSDALGGYQAGDYVRETEGDSRYLRMSIYDTNGNGKVDDSDKLGGEVPSFYDQSGLTTGLRTDLDAHIGDTNVHLSADERAAIDNTPTPPTSLNPFATQADLAAGGNGDMLKAVYDQNDNGIVDDSERLGGALPIYYDQTAHVADVTTNPHNVTKAQVGLGNVDNTTDADKPISTATQAALDTKATLDEANTWSELQSFEGGVLSGGSVTGDRIVTNVNNNGNITMRINADGSSDLISTGDMGIASGIGTAPSSESTIAEIDTTGAKAIITKEYVEANYAQSPDARFMLRVTQAEYDALTPDANTLYMIIG